MSCPAPPITWLVGSLFMPLNGAMSDIDATTPQAVDGEIPLTRLVEAVAHARDRSAFASLFAYFAPRIKAYLMRGGADAGTAEEITQEAMIAVWRRADTFDPAQATVSTWVFTIARNKRIDLLRRERRADYDPDDPAFVPAAE